jgi:hypothetical protein
MSKHPPFKEVENSRPPWREDVGPNFTRTRKPDWKPGEGANETEHLNNKKQVEIDPYAEGRPTILNYKLLISAVIPRPIGFMSTVSKDGMSLHCITYIVACICICTCTFYHDDRDYHIHICFFFFFFLFWIVYPCLYMHAVLT